jgi:uncharacterized membrane protein required for colicin V production
LTEVINLAGVVSITAVAVNFWHPVAEWLRPWLAFDPAYAPGTAFWLIFLTVVFALRLLMARLGEVIKWERLHWTIQGLGLILGGLRGLWWAGLTMLILTSSGFVYLRESVESQSVLGPRLLAVAHEQIGSVTRRFPGAQFRGTVLIPALKTAPATPTGGRHKPAAPAPQKNPWQSTR